MSTGTFISRNARNTPMCAKPRAPPPDKTNATRGRTGPDSDRGAGADAVAVVCAPHSDQAKTIANPTTKNRRTLIAAKFFTATTKSMTIICVK
jgi:hypothetical protein